MALVVTFSALFGSDNVQPPIATGSVARTEQIDIGAASAGGNIGALVARETENVVDLFATADCWVVIGANPTVAAGEGWFINGDTYKQLGIKTGEKVAVIEA